MAAVVPLATLSAPNLTGSPAWSASFSIDGKYLAVCFGNPDTHVKVWEHRAVVAREDDDAPPTTAPSAGKRRPAGREWRLMATISEDHTRTIRSVAFAPTSSTFGVPILATASFDGKVLIWEHYPDEGDEFGDGADENADAGGGGGEDDTGSFGPIAQLEGHESEVKCLAWNARGTLLASCGRDKSVWIWECFLPGTVGGAESNANTMFAGGDDGGGEFECVAVLQGHDGDVKSVAFGPSHSQWGDGEEVLYSASYDDTIRVWANEGGDWYCAATLANYNTGGAVPRPVATTDGGAAPTGPSGPVHSSTVWCLGLTPGGVRMFSGSEDGSVGVWKMYTASERRKLFPRASGAVCATDGLWNCVGKLPDAHSGYAVLSIDCAPSGAGHGRILSGGGDDCINVYREVAGAVGDGITSDVPKFTLEATTDNAHDGDVNCVRWHPKDGTCFVSCGDDGAVRLWTYQS